MKHEGTSPLVEVVVFLFCWRERGVLPVVCSGGSTAKNKGESRPLLCVLRLVEELQSLKGP